MIAGGTGGRLQIGDVAERTGLSLRTIRYYEDVGLLPTAERSAGGFRLYNDDAVERLLVIKHMKPLDFSLEEMRELLDTLDQLDRGTGDDQRRAELGETVARYEALVGERVLGLSKKLAAAQQFRRSLEERVTALATSRG